MYFGGLMTSTRVAVTTGTALLETEKGLFRSGILLGTGLQVDFFVDHTFDTDVARITVYPEVSDEQIAACKASLEKLLPDFKCDIKRYE